DDAQALGRLLAALAGARTRLAAQLCRELVHIDCPEQLADCLGAHAGLKDAAALLDELAIFGLVERLTRLDELDLLDPRRRRHVIDQRLALGLDGLQRNSLPCF